MRELVLCVSGGRTFHTEGRAKAKVLKGDCEQKILGRVRKEKLRVQ